MHGQKMPMVYELLTSFQGRIDSPYLYGMKKRELLYEMGFRSLLWDPEVYEYHNTSLSGTAATIGEIIKGMIHHREQLGPA